MTLGKCKTTPPFVLYLVRWEGGGKEEEERRGEGKGGGGEEGRRNKEVREKKSG